MRTIEITAMEDVQVGDLVTLEDRRDPAYDETFTPDPKWRLTGHVRAIDVTHTTRDGKPYGWSVRIGHTPYSVGYLSPGGVMWAYSLVSATREMPDDTAAAVIAAAMVWYQAVEPYDESSPDYDDAFHALRDAVRAHRAAIGGAS